MKRAETVEQYKIMKHIEKTFQIDKVKIELIDRYSIRVTDDYSKSIIFYYDIESESVIEKKNWLRM